MIATQIFSHVADAQANLLTQYRNRPILGGIIANLAGYAQKLEDAAFPMSVARQIINSTISGAQLDGVGQLVGLARQGLTDDEYRLLIFGTIAQNNSNGTNETILALARRLFQASAAAVISPYSAGHSRMLAAGSLGIEVGDPQIDPVLYPLIISILQKSIAAAICLSWVTTYSGDDAFAFDGPTAGFGFDDLSAPGQGGALGSLAYTGST